MASSPLIELDRPLQELVEAEIAPGETIVWAKQPIPRWFSPPIGHFVMGVLWTALVGYLFATTWRPVFASSWRDAVAADWIAISVFFGIGLLMLTSPWRARRRLRNTVYVITDLRAIVLRRRALRSRSVMTFEPDRLMHMERIERADGSGDLIFEVVTTGSGSSTSTERRGFLSVAAVGDVDALVRRTLVPTRVRVLAAEDRHT